MTQLPASDGNVTRPCIPTTCSCAQRHIGPGHATCRCLLPLPSPHAHSPAPRTLSKLLSSTLTLILILILISTLILILSLILISLAALPLFCLNSQQRRSQILLFPSQPTVERSPTVGPASPLVDRPPPAPSPRPFFQPTPRIFSDENYVNNSPDATAITSIIVYRKPT